MTVIRMDIVDGRQLTKRTKGGRINGVSMGKYTRGNDLAMCLSSLHRSGRLVTSSISSGAASFGGARRASHALFIGTA